MTTLPERQVNSPVECCNWLVGYQQEAQQRGEQLRATESRWAWARLLAFGAAVVVWWLTGGVIWLAALLSAGSLGLFVCSIRNHRGTKARRKAADRLLVMIGEAQQRCGGRVRLIRSWQHPEDPTETGAALPSTLESGEFWALTDQERDDLNLYAPPVGMFGLLNRCSTILGARRLSQMLDHPLLSPERIRLRQVAVHWLHEHPAERLGLMSGAAALRGQDDSLDRLVRALRGASPLPGSMLSRYLRWWTIPSALIVLAVIGGVAMANFKMVYVFLALLLFNGLLFERTRRELRSRLEPWRNLTPTLCGYLVAARQAVTDLPVETELGSLRKHFRAVRTPRVLPALCRILPWGDSGGLFHALANILFFYDLHVAEAILGVAVPHRDKLIAGLSALADLEALLSLGSFAGEQPVACYARPSDKPTVKVTGGRHPLIPPERVVPNQVMLAPEANLWIITGSNMSGKSTLLRMVGVNTLLAQMGTVATAEEMIFRPVRLISDLQARDSLPDEESYFLAEVRHVRRMVLPPEGPDPVLGLLDEPFRGTNSQEQLAASLAVVQYLLGSPNFFLVATHEQRLTELAEGTRARNYHFAENLSSDGLVFDYRLCSGPTQTRNALRVLEREGYPPDILARAGEWMSTSRSGNRPPKA